MSTTIFEVENHVAYIKLNRPESMNALNPELRYALSQHLDEVENNKDYGSPSLAARETRLFVREWTSNTGHF